MDKNNKFLTFLLCCCLSSAGCFFGEDKEFIYENPDYYPILNEMMGKYYYAPTDKDNKIYSLIKENDTSFLTIKKDSTYTFNKMYYNQGEVKKNVTGRIKMIDDKELALYLDTSQAKVNVVRISGFKKSKKNELYYYYVLASPTDPTEFHYYILYKKME